MEDLWIGLGGLAVLIVLLAIGVHVGVALAVTGFAGVVLMTNFNSGATLLASGFFYKIADKSLITVPLFVLMGLLAAAGEISDNLYNAAAVWMNKVKTGLGMATVVACAGFGAVCGSSLVTASVFAKVSAPHMRTRGYSKQLSYGICASAGMIGMLIPPSVLAVIYAFVSGESVGKLQIAGAGPGILITILFGLGLFILSKIKPQWVNPSSGDIKITWKKRLNSLLPTWPVLIVACVVFGGVFRGVFSPTEAASIAAFIMLVLLIVIRRRKAKRDLLYAFTETSAVCAMIFVITGGGTVFSNFLVLSGVTPMVTKFILGSGLSVMSMVLAIIVLYLILGCFLDGISMVVITVPVLHPVMVSLGVDPVWYAMVAILSMEIGLITPPVGLNVYGTQAVAEPDVRVEDVFAGSIPFFFMALIGLGILLAFPQVATFLPNVMIPR